MSDDGRTAGTSDRALPDDDVVGPGDDEADISSTRSDRTELEESIGRLATQGQDALAVQGRLRGLLRANAAVVSDLSLPVVLRQIVAAAKDLVDARYAALGVVRSGVVEQFIHLGMRPDEVERVGELPHGRGILGMLIENAAPLRISELSAHPAAVGFPANHPLMGSFLGVPIRVRNEVFGNLYLTDSASGQFSAEDEHLVTALAATAGVAIGNADLYGETEQQRQWLSASAELTQQLFAGSEQCPLDLVLRYAVRGAQADSATLVMRVNDTQLRVEAAAGVHAEQLLGRVVPSGSTLAGQVIESGKPMLTEDYLNDFGDTTFDSALVAECGVPIRTAIGVPLLAAGNRVLGALTLGRVPGRPEFTEIDRDQLAGFASHVGLALELDRARTEHEALRTIKDRDRIAADLHDHVIQELFATGMGLQSMLSSLGRTDLQARVAGYVDALDATIRQIRTTIFELQTDRRDPPGLQHRMLIVLDEEAVALGFTAGIDFAGPLNHQVSGRLADDVVAVVREALSNTARHARAGAVHVRIAAVGATVALDITDDGCGIGTAARSSGLTNIRRRAEAHNGAFEIFAPTGGGTHLHWTARTVGTPAGQG